MKASLYLPSSCAAAFFVFISFVQAEELPINVQQRLDRVQSTLEAYQQVDTGQVVISNSAGSEVTFNLRENESKPWHVEKLGSGQTMIFSCAQIISLVTPKRDIEGFHDYTYVLQGGNRYVIYWNQEYWDLVKVANRASN